MQSATNLIKIGYKIRKLEQFENQNSDFLRQIRPAFLKNNLLLVNVENFNKIPDFTANYTYLFSKINYFQQKNR